MSDRNSPRIKTGTPSEEKPQRSSSSVNSSSKDKLDKKKRLALKKQRLEKYLKNKNNNRKLCVAITPKKQKRAKKPDLSDENTTNSENSEGNGLYHDVDWEGNLENDAQLDEFAPRRRTDSPSIASFSEKIFTESNPPLTSVNMSHTHFETGEKVRVLNYNTSSWEDGVVEETDDLEQEILVVSNGRKEWVNINSQRISKTSQDDDVKRGDDKSIEPPSLSLGAIIETGGAEPTPSVDTKQESSRSPMKKSAKEIEKMKAKSMKDSLYLKVKRLDKLRRKPVPRRKDLPGSSRSAVTAKFAENEQVLAKWSHHRMQKFPAVIKKVLGNGEYDVIFYDGFIKTISEDNIYKATEEECAKYQGTNPSKADSFVEMDEDSKQARRQRKKKTFDDFLSPKDFERARRKFPVESGVRRLINQKRSVGVKRLQSKIGFVKRRRKIKAPRSLDGSPPSAEPSAELEESEVLPADAPPLVAEPTSTVQLEDEKIDVQDTLQPSQEPADSTSAEVDQPAPVSTPIASPTKSAAKVPVEPLPDQPSISANETVKKDASDEPPPVPPVVLPPTPAKGADYGDRFLCGIPEGAVPVFVKTKDCMLHRSVIIGDRNLLPNWVKHAVFIRGKQQVFLISPEGFKINTRLDLQDYYARTLKVPAPLVLDFVVDSYVIPALKEKQKDMEVSPVRFPTWKIKKGKGRPGARSRFTQKSKFKNPIKTGPSQSGRVGKVRTLLPKYRYVPVPLEPPEPEAETVWKCPKEGCEKTFRKESLLQMHIKHYHAEFKALVGTAPNVVDLALARSESNYAESLKPQLQPVKRPASKTSPQVGLTERNDSEYSSSPAQGSISPHVGPSFLDDVPSLSARSMPTKRIPPILEEKKTTIKTLLPMRQPAVESQNSVTADSDDFDSEDEFARLQKLRLKKMKYDSLVPRDIRLSDHGYPMSPSFKYTKKKQPALEKLQITTDSNDSYTEEEKGSPVEFTEDGVVIERMRSEEIINCSCGFREEDGLMIQCDICMCWQHGLCCNIVSDVHVPERYVCYICRHPLRVRSSNKFDYAVHYLTLGKLPTFSFRTKDERIIKERENIIKKCFDLTSNLHQMGNVGQSLAVKLKIAEKRDHPKLYLWAKNWRTNATKKDSNDVTKSVVPEPEAPIDFEDCRERLVKDVENDLQQLDERLNLISNHISCLEAQASGSGQSDANVSSRTIKQTVQMLTKDLKDLERLAAISQP